MQLHAKPGNTLATGHTGRSDADQPRVDGEALDQVDPSIRNDAASNGRHLARRTLGPLLPLGLALGVAGAPALSQGRLDADVLKHFGGTYMVDCTNNASPKANVLAGALEVTHQSRRIAGRNVQSAASYFGPNPAPDFRTVLLSEVGDQQLLFVIYQDRSGVYLVIDGSAKMLGSIGKSLAGRKFRRCGSAPQPQPVAAPAQERYAMHELSAAGLLLDPRAKAAYYKALGPLVREPWLARLDGPSPQNRQAKLANTEFIVASACKNHDCADHNTVLLYSAAQNVVYGKVFQRGRSTLIGVPPPAVAFELERLWKSEWRRNR